MSIQAIAQVLDLELDDPSAKLVLIGIANHTSPTGQCFPSVARLCRYSGLGESTVREVIKRLETAGYIAVDRKPGRTSIYYLTLPLQNLEAPPPAAGGPPLQQLDPNRNKNRKDNASDARAGLSDGWQPSDALRAKLDRDYPTIDIDDQVKAFILQNKAKGTIVANPDAAFEVWMMRVTTLRLPVKTRVPPATVAGRDPRDPATAALRHERDAKTAQVTGNPDKAAEEWLTAAGIWQQLHAKDGEAQRCAAEARAIARPGSWAEDQVNQFIARHWGEHFQGVADA